MLEEGLGESGLKAIPCDSDVDVQPGDGVGIIRDGLDHQSIRCSLISECAVSDTLQVGGVDG